MTENQKRKVAIENYVKQMELEKVWKGDMLDYLRKSLDSVIELENGDLIGISKPYIQTYMGTGYSTSGQGISYEEANEVAEDKQKDFEYFIEKNIKYSDLEHYIKCLKDDSYIKSIANHYCSCPKDSKIKAVFFSKPWNFEEDNAQRNLTIISQNDIDKLIKGYEAALERFKKRLETYLKKFGLEHCNFETYWLDR